jgi:hypothetical protein
VVFPHDYASIVLLLAILGTGAGGTFSYYIFKDKDISQAPRIFAALLVFLENSLLLLLAAVRELRTTAPFNCFALLLLPFFLAGMFCSQWFKYLAEGSFRLCA